MKCRKTPGFPGVFASQRQMRVTGSSAWPLAELWASLWAGIDLATCCQCKATLLSTSSSLPRAIGGPALLIDVVHADFAVEHGLNLIFEGEIALGTEFVHVSRGLVLQVTV